MRLEDGEAQQVDLVGAKAAALAVAAGAGLPVLPGFVVTTDAMSRHDEGDEEVSTELKSWFEGARGDERHILIVRSSSPFEDQEGESMAGRFETIAGVESPEDLLDALHEVLESRAKAAEGVDWLSASDPIAALVQTQIDPEMSGILFGVDPVDGRTDRRVVVAARGRPDRLVGGEEEGTRYVLDPEGRTVDSSLEPSAGRVPADVLRRLVEFGNVAEELFDGPQDIEWAHDREGRTWLLQSRPVTTTVTGVPQGPVLGAGPVGETFPDPLCRLEQDMWVPPLRSAMAQVLEMIGATSPGELESSPVVTVVGGRVVVDLDLLEGSGGRLDLRRRLAVVKAAWRVGRLERAVPRLADLVVEESDRALLEVPSLEDLSDRQLIGTITRSRQALLSLHAYELMMGLLVEAGSARLSANSVALRLLAAGREEGKSDQDIIAQEPIVLSLMAPRVGPTASLPREVGPLEQLAVGESDENGVLREALRVRIRWVHELMSRCAWALGARLTESGWLEDIEQVRHYDIEALESGVRGVAVAIPAPAPASTYDSELPTRFRLSDRGKPIPVGDEKSRHGIPAGGGQGEGTVTHDESDPEDGSVLVVGGLSPDLAPLLSRLAGLVSERGNVLSHVAILAREQGIPAVVGYPGARETLHPGDRVTVDGATGKVAKDGEEGDEKEEARGWPVSAG